MLKGIERPERSRANGHNIVGRRRQAPTPATTGAHVRPPSAPAGLVRVISFGPVRTPTFAHVAA